MFQDRVLGLDSAVVELCSLWECILDSILSDLQHMSRQLMVEYGAATGLQQKWHCLSLQL